MGLRLMATLKDPRLEARLSVSANGMLSDSYIRHALAFTRLENGQVQDLIGWLNTRTFPELLGMTESRLMRIRGRTAGVFKTKAYQRFMADAKSMLVGGFRSARRDFARELYRIAQAEAQFTVTALGRAIPFDFRAKLPPAKRFREIVDAMPIHGADLKTRFDSLAVNTFDRFRREVNLGIVNKETTEQIVSRIRGTQAARYTDGVLGTSRRWAESEVRSAVNHVGNGGRGATAAENDEVVEKEKWYATLDDRTCPICAGLDGQVFKTGEGPIPPEHIGCRCFRAPVLKSARQLGFKKGDLPEVQRRTMDGRVPEKVTFGKWMRGQDRKLQDEVLGPTRAKLWRSGRVPLDRFVNDKRQVLNLEQLAAREGIRI
jgi:SPP1 gp7 family putative phage head morphogenesis protein